MKIPKSEMNTKQICDDMVFGMGRVHILKIAIQLNVFAQLKEGAAKIASEVAAALGTDGILTEKFLNALVAMKYLEKKDGKYSLTSISKTFLVPEEPLYYGDAAMLFSEMRSSLTNLSQILKDGPHSPISLGMDRSMVRALGMYTLANELQEVIGIVTPLPEFGSMKKMLEIGGGVGYYSLALCSLNPELKAVVFDPPMATSSIKEIISEHNGGGQVQTMDGDITSSSLGEGYDLIIASHSLYYWPNYLEMLFGKIFDALNPGGVFVFNHSTLIDEETEPEISVLDELVSTAMGAPHALPVDTTLSALKGAGYKDIEEKWAKGGPNVRCVFIARKEKGGKTT